jgi:quercetin dioxygenase-like cupin family protein
MQILGLNATICNSKQVFTYNHLKQNCGSSIFYAKSLSKEKTMEDEIRTGSFIDMIEYQKDAIVSKTIIEKKTGTVTLFSFDQGQGLSEHTAPFDALVQILDGAVEIKISGKPFTLKKGEMIIMPANEPHALKAVEQFKMLLTMIRS